MAEDWEAEEHPWDQWASFKGWFDVDRNPVAPLDRAQVEKCLFHYSHGMGDEGGESATVLQMTDAQYVCWETWMGCTGSGFHPDAIGGDVEVFVGDDLHTLIRLCLSERSRRELGVVLEGVNDVEEWWLKSLTC